MAGPVVREVGVAASVTIPVPFKEQKGPRVVMLRRWLSDAGFKSAIAPAGVDDYDAELSQTVAAFQRKLGVNPTGVWDDVTYNAALKDLELPNTVLRPVGIVAPITPSVSTPAATGLTALLSSPVVLVVAGIGLLYLFVKPRAKLSVSGLDLLESGDDDSSDGDASLDVAPTSAAKPKRGKAAKRSRRRPEPNAPDEGLPEDPPM